MNTEISILNENEVNFNKVINERISKPDFRDDAFYVCDLGRVYQQYKLWMDKLPRVKLFYAVKSNNSEPVLKLFVSLKMGFDCASPNEMKIILNLGASPDRIIYSQPVKLLSHLLAAKNYNVKLTVFDGYDEIVKIKQHYPAARLMLRIKMDALKCTSQLSVKSGCDPDTDGKKLIEVVAKEGLNLVGIMFHVGSGCFEPEVFDRAIKKARELFDYAQQFGITCSTVNIGGGFIGERARLDLFNKTTAIINNAIDMYFNDLPDVEFMSEPGQYFCCESTVFASHIHSRRVLRDETDNIKEIMYYLSDGVSGPFNRQFYIEEPTVIKLLKKPQDETTYTTSLWGPTCSPFDFIFKNIQLPELFLGDWLIFEKTGSYTFVMSNEFNGFTKSWLNFNSIEVIDKFLFRNVNNLRYLNLEHNRIRFIDQSAFHHLTILEELRLSDNLLVELPECVFCKTSLDALYLGFNNIKVTPYTMRDVDVTYLNLDGIGSTNINFNVLTNMSKLDIIVYAEFFYCSMTPTVKKCTPKSDGVSSVTDLLTKPILRYSAWVMAILTCFGNMLVIWGRSTLRDENRTVSMVIRNLAVADMLMGFYLAIIGVQDFRYREVYNTRAHEWMESWSCVATGILAMISSEVSILIMAFMSVERFLLIADPFGGYQKLNGHNVFFSLFSIWLLGTTLAIVPVIVWRSSTLFYGKYSGTCFPLHLQEKYALGWQYSAFIFIGLNMTLLVVIAILYSALLFSIWRTRKATPLSMLDCEFVIRFFFIVFTDASCWIPIIIYKVLVFMSVQISADMYAWLIVFILPLNSAINPLLYTFTTPRYRDKFFWNSWHKIKFRNQRRTGSGGTSNQDDSQGKIMPLLYTTTAIQKNWRF